MKIYSKLQVAGLCALAMAMAAPVGASAKAEDNTGYKQEYRFRQTETPVGFSIFNVAFCPYSENEVYTVNSLPMPKVGKTIVDFDVNPSGANYLVIGGEKKGNKASLFNYSGDQGERGKLKVKELGNPIAAAYSSDARRVYIATDKGLQIMDATNLLPLDNMEIVDSVNNMVVSGNGYFLAVSTGNEVVVYNIEEKSVRHRWDFESKVNDMTFNDDSSEFAILTEDGLLSIYDTRNFLIKRSLDDLGEGLSCSFNFDGKYIAVVESPDSITIINLLQPTDRETITVPNGHVRKAAFIPDMNHKTLLLYTSLNALEARRMNYLTPYYAKLIADEANEKMSEWLKMMPDETIEQYNARVNDESRKRQQRLFEDEISTQLAPDMLSMANISLGSYDRANGVLAVDFTNMPTIYLPVAEGDLGAFTNAGDLTFSNAKYGVTGDDSFELIYAEVYNKADGKTYVYDNIDRVPLNFMQDADNVVSIELIQQQQMEEMKLKEIQASVTEAAKKENIISEHTDITVDSKIEPGYDANGNRIMNYKVNFSYQVDPAFTAAEDFAPGKYHAEQSGAAKAMLEIVKQAFEGDFAQYLKAGKKLNVKISGTADATPIVSRIIYDGAYGDFDGEPVSKNGKLTNISMKKGDRVTENDQLAFLRAAGVKSYLMDNVKALNDMRTDYNYDIQVSEGKGSEYRRITTEFTFVDAF